MKRSLSFLLALMVVAGMNLNSFAVTAMNDNNHPETITTEAASAVLSLGMDEASGLTLSSILEANQSFRFPILLDGSPAKAEQLEDYRLRVETAEGRGAVRSIKIVEEKGEYLLEVKTLSGYPNKLIDYVGQLKLVKKSGSKVEATMDLSFSAGYDKVPAASVQSAQADGQLFLDNSAPVITEAQFDFMDRELNGKVLTIHGKGWTYEGRISGQQDVNLVHNETINKDIVKQFKEQNFAFLNFPAAPTFDFNGQLTIDVSDYNEDFGNRFYLYSYYGNKLNRVLATYDEYEETLTFPTRWFGHFVLTDKEIADGTVVNCQDKETAPSQPDNNNSDQGKPNPETGAGLF